MCRTDSWLARKADTWYKWLYKKRSCFKNTQALPFSLKWLQPHYSTWRSLWVFIQYTTLRDNPRFFLLLLLFFHKSLFFCHVINTYDTTDPPLGRFVVWWRPAERKRRIQRQSASLRPSPSASGCRWSGQDTHCSKVNVLLRLNAAEREERRSTSEFACGSGWVSVTWINSGYGLFACCVATWTLTPRKEFTETGLRSRQLRGNGNKTQKNTKNNSCP